MVKSELSFKQICDELQSLDARISGANGVDNVCIQAYQRGESARSLVDAFDDPNKEIIRQLIASGMDEIMNATRGDLYQYLTYNRQMRDILTS